LSAEVQGERFSRMQGMLIFLDSTPTGKVEPPVLSLFTATCARRLGVWRSIAAPSGGCDLVDNVIWGRSLQLPLALNGLGLIYKSDAVLLMVFPGRKLQIAMQWPPKHSRATTY